MVVHFFTTLKLEDFNMSTSIHQNQSRVAGNELSTKERSELLKATMEFLEGLLHDDESLKRQRIKLAATLLRASFP